MVRTLVDVTVAEGMVDVVVGGAVGVNGNSSAVLHPARYQHTSKSGRRAQKDPRCTGLFKDPLRSEHLLDVIQMGVTMQSAVHAELSLCSGSMLLHLLYLFGRELFEFSVYSLGRRQA